MRWDDQHESPDVIDKRGDRREVSLGGFLPFLPLLLRSRFGWVGIIAIAAYVLYTRVGPSLESTRGAPQPLHDAPALSPSGSPESRLVHFVSFVLDDVQAAWDKDFAARGLTYRHAKLVLFTDITRTGCGAGEAASGPFYCSEDERVYIDLSFYRELERRFGARGDFAQAYVVAHEIGHHVQNLLGTTKRARTRNDTATGTEGSSVRLELQADCYAGIWARSTERRQLLETGDFQEALRAASAIGDDRLQKQATGTVSPETWTHGSSEQRSHWLETGYATGKWEACDTFGSSHL